MAVAVQIGAGAVTGNVALVSAGLTLVILQVLASRGEVSSRSVGLPAFTVSTLEILADVAPSFGLTGVDSVTMSPALSALLGLKAVLSQMTELLTDGAL